MPQRTCKGPRIRASRALLLLAVCMLAGLARYADAALSVEFDIQPRALRVGDTAVCSIRVRGVDNPPTPGLPQIPGFQIGMAGTERNMSFGSGGSDSSVTFRYRLLPLQTGTFTIGPFQYVIGNEKADLPAITIEVVGADAAPEGQTAGQSAQELLFATVTASSTNLYIQQVFDITLAVYAAQGINVGREVSLSSMPATGISLQPFQELGSAREVVSNRIYEVRRFRAKAVALTSGTFNFAPTLRIALLVPRDRRSHGPFPDPFGNDPFFEGFFGRHEAQPVDISASPIDVVVRPLPSEGQPPSFAGAVGRFAFNARVTPTAVAAGEPVTLAIEINGEGNIENVSPPELALGDGFRVYEQKLVAKDMDPMRSAGRKRFEQVLIPRSADIKELPALSFSYFDPATGSYNTLTQGPFPLVVTAASGGVSRVVQAPSAMEGPRTQVLGTDIVYLKPAPGHWRHVGHRPWYRAPAFLIVQMLPPFALAILAIAVRRRTILEKDVAQARRLRAPRAARAGIQRAEAALSSGDRGKFFEALAEALGCYFGDRLNLPPGAITSDIVLERLTRGGLRPEHVAMLAKLFTRCEEARFAASGSAGTLADSERASCDVLLRETHAVLKACEKTKL